MLAALIIVLLFLALILLDTSPSFKRWFTSLFLGITLLILIYWSKR